MDAIAEKVVASTATACFAANRRGRVIAWNAAAAAMLGHPAERALGAHCHSLLRGHDVFGNRLCGPDCPIMEMARRGEPVHDFEMAAGSPSSVQRVHLSSLRLPAAGKEFVLVHLLREVGERRAAAVAENENCDGSLTSRELEVLRMLRRGLGTREIAGVLCISAKTVRNHVQNSLCKLGAHSRLEALAIARRRQLI